MYILIATIIYQNKFAVTYIDTKACARTCKSLTKHIIVISNLTKGYNLQSYYILKFSFLQF